MKSKTLKLRKVLGAGALAVCGVLAFSWLTCIPEVAFAANTAEPGSVETNGVKGTAPVIIKMPNVLSLDVSVVNGDLCTADGKLKTNNSVACMEASIATGDPNSIVSPGKIRTKVISNVKYKISFNTTSTTSAALANSGGTLTIPATTGLTAGTAGWGIQMVNTFNAANGVTTYVNSPNYYAVGKSGSPVTLYSGTGVDSGTYPLDFPIGVAISNVTPAEKYTASLVVTATQY